ncbi:MAG: hypothetical protein F4X44_04335 [Gammaproteobacteria bacterium]|nr:hypothetical protein [Gammaproteobacteria bacterium]MYD79825.1 hypothetical protein [Gammaproteobacteria bacterium]
MTQLSLRGALGNQSSPEETSNPSKKSFLNWLLQKTSGKTIYVYDEPYLTRYYLLGNGSGKSFEIYVHHMHKIDEFRWLHNHPWRWFLSIVLSGSYWQETLNCRNGKHKHEHIRRLNLFRKLDQYHAIRELPKGTAWTLVVVPPKQHDHQWGYWDTETSCHISDETIGHESARTETFGRKVLKD